MISSESHMMLRCWVAVSVIRRSSGFFRADGDQILLLRQPPDGVHEQIAIALDAEAGIRREVRIADDRHPGFRLRRLGIQRVRLRGRGRRRGRSGRCGRRNRDRALLVALRIVQRTLPAASRSLISASAQLCALVCANGCAVRPLTPPMHRGDRARQRKRRHEVEALGDRMRSDSWRRPGRTRRCRSAGPSRWRRRRRRCRRPCPIRAPARSGW